MKNKVKNKLIIEWFPVIVFYSRVNIEEKRKRCHSALSLGLWQQLKWAETHFCLLFACKHPPLRAAAFNPAAQGVLLLPSLCARLFVSSPTLFLTDFSDFKLRCLRVRLYLARLGLRQWNPERASRCRSSRSDWSAAGKISGSSSAPARAYWRVERRGQDAAVTSRHTQCAV